MTSGKLTLIGASQHQISSGKKTTIKSVQSDSNTSRLTSVRQSYISNNEEGLLLHWRDEAKQEGRTATQILQSHSLVIREMEKEGVIPAGFYDRYKGEQDSQNTSNNAIEEVDSCDKSIELNSGLLRAERRTNKKNIDGPIKPKSNPGNSMPDKLAKGTVYIDTSSEEDDSYE